MQDFLLVFIPLFVAIDPLGAIPLFVSMTQTVSPETRKKLALQAVVTGLIAGMVFGYAGKLIFVALGITSSDFQVAGGLLLLILSIKEIFGESVKETSGETADRFMGIVPLGIPLIAGPAMFTTLLILHDAHAYQLVVSGLMLNLLIAYVVFRYSEWIISKVGEATSQVTAKVIAIFLAAIGIMMIRRGIEGFISAWH